MAVSDAEALAYQQNYANLYLGMKFYAIFPNGTKVPLAEISAHMLANPELRPMKMFDDGGTGRYFRLVLVIEMTTPNADGSESLYARQAFYFSTGTNSQMSDTWLPFDGITFGELKRHVIGRSLPIALPSSDPPPAEGYVVRSNLWVDKSPFLGTVTNAREERTKNAIGGGGPYPETLYLFAGSFLPEGLISDRQGPFSHAIASYILGGGEWDKRGPRDFLKYTGSQRPRANYPRIDELSAALTPPRPANPDFVFLRTSPDLPVSSVTEINAYISRNNALSYMNGFINTGVTLPTTTDLSANVIQDDRRFLLPLFFMLDHVREAAYTVMMAYRLGAIASDTATIVAELQNQLADLGVIRGAVPWKIQDHLDRIVFVLSEPANISGGRRKKTRRFKMPRKYSKKYCKKTPCKRMGFTQRSSCRPYKNCF